LQALEPHGYVQTTSPAYLLSLLLRGTSAAAQTGEIGQELVDSFDREARRRVANGSFYGAMLFLSLTAAKSAGDRAFRSGGIDEIQSGEAHVADSLHDLASRSARAARARGSALLGSQGR
jgi:hypothetical protein